VALSNSQKTPIVAREEGQKTEADADTGATSPSGSKSLGGSEQDKKDANDAKAIAISEEKIAKFEKFLADKELQKQIEEIRQDLVKQRNARESLEEHKEKQLDRTDSTYWQNRVGGRQSNISRGRSQSWAEQVTSEKDPSQQQQKSIDDSDIVRTNAYKDTSWQQFVRDQQLGKGQEAAKTMQRSHSLHL